MVGFGYLSGEDWCGELRSLLPGAAYHISYILEGDKEEEAEQQDEEDVLDPLQ